MINDNPKLKNVLINPNSQLGGTRRKFIAQGAAIGAVSLSTPFISKLPALLHL